MNKLLFHWNSVKQFIFFNIRGATLHFVHKHQCNYFCWAGILSRALCNHVFSLLTASTGVATKVNPLANFLVKIQHRPDISAIFHRFWCLITQPCICNGYTKEVLYVGKNCWFFFLFFHMLEIYHIELHLTCVRCRLPPSAGCQR